MASSVVHSFELNKIVAVGTPEAKTVWNQFDEHGLVLSLPRKRGESNHEYKYRLLDVMAHQANATYTGLVNGITRELGLSLFYPITIYPLLRTGGHTIAKDPCVEINYGFVRLWSDYGAGKLDMEIDCWEAGGNAEILSNFVAILNKSIYFNASLNNTSYSKTRTTTLLNQMSRKRHSQIGERSSKWTLEKQYIAPNTAVFRDDKNTFSLEVPQSSLVDRNGSYHLNYTTGTVTSHKVPTRIFSVDYYYNEYEWQPVASPVIVSSVSDNDFKRKMFEQVLLDDGTETHGLPNYFGVDIINELLTITPNYWGQ